MATRRRYLQLVALCSVFAALSAQAGMPALPNTGNPQTLLPPSELLPAELPPGGQEALCFLRDRALSKANVLFKKLQLNDLFKNYYCDGGCYQCCYVPDAGCHSSFDYDDMGNPPINCSPAVYGPGTTILGEALIVGDSLGLGICIGGVQQLCTQFPVCNAVNYPPAAPGFATSGDEGSDGAPGSPGGGSSPAPTSGMSSPGAPGSLGKAYVKTMNYGLTQVVLELPTDQPHRDWVDFATARGAVNWREAMAGIEPYSGDYQAFRVEDSNGALLPHASYLQGILYHANLALLGAVPNVLQRLAHVETRFWSIPERNDYLAGIDPEAELRKTMGPIALAALKSLPIQDWRLLAQAAPGETPLPYRSYEGFELGEAPLVTAAQDCGADDEVSLAVQIDDPQAVSNPDTLYPVSVNWGDGSFSQHEYDSSQPTHVYRHGYAAAGNYMVYVTASNGSGLRGVAGVVVEAAAPSAEPAAPSIATVELDAMKAYGPALIRAGKLSFEVEAVRPDGQTTVIGWSNPVTLPNAGPVPLARMIGFHDTLEPLSAIALRPHASDGYKYDSVYFQSPSITLGFWDPQVGAVTTRTLPLTDDLVQVYYQGATAPVPAALLEHDVNGDLILPVDRATPGLAAGFCGAAACKLVDRIEIPLTPGLLAGRPASSPGVPAGLHAGSLARWSEDVPNTFIALPPTGPGTLSGACSGSLAVDVVSADEPRESWITALSLTGPAPDLAGDAPLDLRATATLASGAQIDVTDRVTWSSSDPTVLRVSNAGDKGRLTRGIVPGTSTISASLGGLTASAAGSNGSAERGFRIYRILITSIQGSIGRAGISSAELLVDGRVLDNLMTGAAAGTIGPFPASVSSSAGSAAQTAFDASFLTGWTSANGSFSTQSPFAVGATPVYLQVDFGRPVPIEGIRLHRQAGSISASFLPQFPKGISVQGSNDGSVFQELVTQVISNWNYQPVEIRWDVPDPDADHDGAPDVSDNCPVWPNPGQLDSDANGIGNDCECGDQNGSGKVDISDLIAVNAAIFTPSLATPLCDTNDDDRCDVRDIVGVNLKIFGQPAYCARYPAP